MKTRSLEKELRTAVDRDDAGTVHRLLEQVEPSQRHWERVFNRSADCLLLVAAEKNSIEAARVLLRYHAPVDEVGSAGFTALEIAAQKGHREMCKLLLEHGADSSRQSRSRGITSALTAAAYRGDVELVDLLLRFDADPADVCSGRIASLIRIRGDVLRRLIAAGGKVPSEITELLRSGGAIGD